MSQCSVTAAQDTAGAWTDTDKRSKGLALDLAADPCVSNSQITNTSWRKVLDFFSRIPLIFRCLSLVGIENEFVLTSDGPTPRPDVHPLPPGTHLLFAQSGRIEHVPLEGYDMKKDDAKTVLHLPVSFSCERAGSTSSLNSFVWSILFHLLRTWKWNENVMESHKRHHFNGLMSVHDRPM